MKMHVKLCLTFSVLILCTQALTAFAYYWLESRNFQQSAEANLTTLGERMIRQLEEHVQVMDYTLETLISDAEFMDAMAMLAQPGQWSEAVLRESSSVITGVLYRNALNKTFYRVNMFNREGTLFSSRANNRDTVNANTFDMASLVRGIPWVERLDAQPFKRAFLPPYVDPWTHGREQWVFGAARGILWLGQPTGYLEVQSPAEELDAIFATGDFPGMHVHVETREGTKVYATAGEAEAGGISLTLTSDMLGLVVSLHQSGAVLRASVREFALRISLISLIVLLIGAAVVTWLSMRITRSMRRLEGKIRAMDFQEIRMAAQSSPEEGGGDEIRRLGLAFDALVERLRASIEDEMRLRDLHNQARFGALQAQINPHFIYNTLNMIASKSLESGDMEVVEICSQFASMLRYSNDMQATIVTVAEELAHVRDYLALASGRYEDRLRYRIDMPEDMLRVELPRVTLQPLVENAITHGYRDSVGIMDIRLAGLREGKWNILRVSDNGDGFPPDMLAALQKAVRSLDQPMTTEGIGLLNTFARIYFHYKKNMEIRLYNQDGAVVELLFPEED